MTAEADVVVIGGGVYGVSVAYHLARFGIATVLIERGDPGSEASGASAGNLHLQLSALPFQTRDPSWVEHYARLLPFFAEAVAEWHGLLGVLVHDFELRVLGGLTVAETEADMALLRRKTALEQRHGLMTQLLDRAALRRLAPELDERLIGAVYAPGEGSANPMLAIRAMLHLAVRRGVRILTQTEATGLSETRGGWRVTTSGGDIRCGKVVIAAGVGSDSVASLAGVRLPMLGRVIHMNVTEPSAPVMRNLLYHAGHRLTMKQVPNGNVVIGGGWPAQLDARFGRPAVLRRSLESSLWVAQRVVPAVGQLHLLRSWAGRIVETADGYPLLGAVPGRPGLSVAVSNAYGFTLGPLCGRLVAEQVAGRKPTHDIRPFAVERFSNVAAGALH